MKAAYIERLGDASEIRYGELPDPVPSDGQVLVRVEAVAVDPVDTLLRAGRWHTELSFPLAVGRDLVGTVVGSGAAVSGFESGDRVWTNSAGYGGRAGATAELVPVYADRLYRLPQGADPVQFVAALHPGATAYGALLDRARLLPGECVAVIGANGAVGMCAVQVAAAAGAEVIASVRQASAAERLRELGAAHVVVADAASAPAAVAAAAPAGIDVVIDTSRHLDVSSMPERLNPRGRIVLIAGAGHTKLDLHAFYLRELQLLGFVMSEMTVSELTRAAERIDSTHPACPLTVSVGRVLSFAEAAQAHTMLETGRLPRMPDGTVGRLVLTPRRPAG